MVAVVDFDGIKIHSHAINVVVYSNMTLCVVTEVCHPGPFAFSHEHTYTYEMELRFGNKLIFLLMF